MSETIEETLIKHMDYIGKLTKQRDDLLTTCEIGLSYIRAVANGVPRPLEDLSPDMKTAKAAIDAAKKGI